MIVELIYTSARSTLPLVQRFEFGQPINSHPLAFDQRKLQHRSLLSPPVGAQQGPQFTFGHSASRSPFVRNNVTVGSAFNGSRESPEQKASDG
ncbi:MAG TPA: hypothetical protein VIJ55_09445 [Acetobacteraceae bacterium]